MDWRYKAGLQYIFSIIPYGEDINYLFQKNITKNLPLKELKIKEKLLIAEQHIENFYKYTSDSLEQATFYEFGAGWDLVQPLLFYSLGVNHQVLIDIRKLIRIELINKAIEEIQHISSYLKLQRIPKKYFKNQLECIDELMQFYGIQYRAPFDARKTNLEQETIDYIVSTNTLEHIPPDDIIAILKECYRLLKNDGAMSFKIDYQDHYSYFDSTISVYNFLQFNNKIWNLLFNPSLHYQNRLRHQDYLNIFSDIGFEVLEDKIIEGTESDLDKINKLSISQDFSQYNISALSIRGTTIVLKKKTDKQL
ncbi:class I SAM-dependent methyltransferase [Nostoc sp. FACHB-892]|uniref:class I SAM-dependent methyltransferase n=1 Tax=Nostoc sp. FACHB-892 TaxID=2692843 RepID=UPI00168A3794|nr:class I SAM-dependent methyltransferase [Nostoc sp. FACHB-892]MBD2729998.1 class I SAM-dependent methyltransferase [Nostoc sp. FACHB-892]